MKRSFYILTILSLLFISTTVSANGARFGAVVSTDNVQVVLNEPPVFLAPAELGFYVAVGIPYDMFLIEGSYYLYTNNLWYASYDYNGPWTSMSYKKLPHRLRIHDHRQIIIIRDREYKDYNRGHDYYRGKKYRPEGARNNREEREDARYSHSRYDNSKEHNKGRGK